VVPKRHTRVASQGGAREGRPYGLALY